ncbi:hypothetical protein HK405_011184, partial [Cladochytrium tenue]
MFGADAASPYVPGAVLRPLSDRLAAQLAPDGPLLRLILRVSSDSSLLNETAVDKLPISMRDHVMLPAIYTGKVKFDLAAPAAANGTAAPSPLPDLDSDRLWPQASPQAMSASGCRRRNVFSSLFAALDAHASLSECKDFTALHCAVELAHIGAGEGGDPRRRGIAAGKPTGALVGRGVGQHGPSADLCAAARVAGTPDLVPLVLRTCGTPRTQREALLLLASMVNADEPVDATGFHTHATANPDVECRADVGGQRLPQLLARGRADGGRGPRGPGGLGAEAGALRLRSRQCAGEQLPRLGPLAVALVKFLLGAAAAGSAGGAPLQAQRADPAFGHLGCVEALLDSGIAAEVGRRPLMTAARARNVTSEAEAKIRRIVDDPELLAGTCGRATTAAPPAALAYAGRD